jgi:cyclophilin family peptidyl-prolyl cis-trans isomerase
VLLHDLVKSGLLGTATAARARSIPVAPTPWLDGRHVVFGKVIKGMDVVKAMEAQGSRSGRTEQPVVLEDCRQL